MTQPEEPNELTVFEKSLLAIEREKAKDYRAFQLEAYERAESHKHRSFNHMRMCERHNTRQFAISTVNMALWALFLLYLWARLG